MTTPPVAIVADNVNDLEGLERRLSARRAGGGAALHPATADLVSRFSAALTDKLLCAQEKYGYSDGWLSPDWMDECRAKLIDHVAKGDPRDVAAYCAFLWHHGEKTFVPMKADPYEALMNEVMTCGGVVASREIAFDHATFDMFMQRHAGRAALQGGDAASEAVTDFPFYELRFIMRVLGNEGRAPKEDWKTAYGMARALFLSKHPALTSNSTEKSDGGAA